VCSKLHEFCPALILDDLNFERRAYGARAAYAQSKLAELLFARELERRLGVFGDGDDVDASRAVPFRCLAVHPGNIVTGVVRTLPKIVQTAYRIIMGAILLTPAEGARASLYAATREEALEGTGAAPYFESDCANRRPSAAAVDDEAAKALWVKTMETLGLDAGFEP
jgi:NAD(P)-dependent dehydrogenase (short-subunit alcohol dehydrogenase family)